MGTHGKDDLDFDSLDFAGQSRSINGTIRHLERQVRAHMRRAGELGKDEAEVVRSRIDQIRRMIDRLSV